MYLRVCHVQLLLEVVHHHRLGHSWVGKLGISLNRAVFAVKTTK